MSITLSSASLPIFTTMLSNLSHCLDKAIAYAETRKFDPNVLLSTRLAPDMLPFVLQVRIACDSAKFGAARLAGLDAPVFADDETSLVQLKDRIARTVDYLKSIPANQVDGRENAEISFRVGPNGPMRTMLGEAYLKEWVLPNFFFHVTTTYALLRHNGVDLGKADYLAGVGG